MAIFALFRFQISGTRKVSGNFRQEKVSSGKFHAKFFAEIGCIFATYRKPEKTAKKDGFQGFRGFQDFRGRLFRNFPFIPILIYLVYPVAQSVFCETPKMHKLFGISEFWKSGKF
jgi:hypothetical protein